MEFDNRHASSSADREANRNASDAGESAEGQHGHDTAKEQEREVQALGRRRRKRKVAKWPDDQIVVTELTEKGMPTEKKAVRRMTKLAGLIARQRLSLIMPSFNDLTEDDKKNLFDECVLPTLEFEESLRDKACHVIMMMVSHSWRTFKSELVRNFVRKGLNAREKHPFIKDQEWNEFVKIQQSEEAKQKSEKFRKIRAMNKHDHCLGTTGYDGAAEKWKEQDMELAAEGITNPWHRFLEGRSRGYLRGHGKLVKTPEGSAKIQWVSKSTEKLSEKVVEKQAELESLGLSNTWVRNKDVLAQALGPERTGRVRGVSSYFGWKHWPDCSNMYRKRKRSYVDVDALRDELRDELRGELRVEVTKDIIAMLREQGVILPLPSDTLRLVGAKYNSCASVSDAVCNISQLDGPGSGISYPVDLVTEPTDCALVINPGGSQVEVVAKGQVFPEITELDSVPVQDGYVVVQVDYVEQKHKSLLLTPPTSSEVKTLGEALFRSLQWRKGDIVLSPEKVPNTSSLGTTRHGSSAKTSVKDLLSNVSSSQVEKVQSALTSGNCASKDNAEANKHNNKSTHGTPGSSGASRAPKTNTKRGQQASVKQQQQQQHAEPSTRGRAPKSNTKRGQQVAVKQQQQQHTEPAKLSTANLEFEFGQPMLSAEELDKAGPGCAALHAYYMNACAENKNTGIIGCLPHNYFFHGREYELLTVGYEGLFDLLKLHALDLGILRVMSVMHIATARLRLLPIAILDPDALSLAALRRDRDYSVNYLESVLKQYRKHRCVCVMFAYNCRNHWITVLILPHLNKVLYLDSNRGKKTDLSLLKSVIDEACENFQKDMYQGQPIVNLVHATKTPCLQQGVGNTSGFYAAHNMLSMMVYASKDVFKAEDLDFTTEREFNMEAIRDTIAAYISKEILRSDGMFHHH